MIRNALSYNNMYIHKEYIRLVILERAFLIIVQSPKLVCYLPEVEDRIQSTQGHQSQKHTRQNKSCACAKDKAVIGKRGVSRPLFPSAYVHPGQDPGGGNLSHPMPA